MYKPSGSGQTADNSGGDGGRGKGREGCASLASEQNSIMNLRGGFPLKISHKHKVHSTYTRHNLRKAPTHSATSRPPVLKGVLGPPLPAVQVHSPGMHWSELRTFGFEPCASRTTSTAAKPTVQQFLVRCSIASIRSKGRFKDLQTTK